MKKSFGVQPPRKRNPKGKKRGNRAKDGQVSQSKASGFMAASSGGSMVVRAMPLFPYRSRRSLTYYAAGSLITGTSTANDYVFSANGAYDPDITGTGGQPMGFDQMMAYYNHYTVLRSRIRVIAVNTSTTIMPTFGLYVSGATTVTSVIEQLVENGDCEFVWLKYAGMNGCSCTLTRSIDCAKFQGIDDVLDDPNMRGDGASNPTEQSYFHLTTWNSVSATQVTSNFQAVIEFDIMFTEPRKATLSATRQNPAADDCEWKTPTLSSSSSSGTSLVESVGVSLDTADNQSVVFSLSENSKKPSTIGGSLFRAWRG